MTKRRPGSETERRRYGPPAYSRAGEATRAQRVSGPWLQAKPRTCLRCANSFDSPHAGVRICPECRRLEDHRSR